MKKRIIIILSISIVLILGAITALAAFVFTSTITVTNTAGNIEIIARLKKEVAIWNINSFGEFYMQIFEKYHNDYIKACDAFRAERELFSAELKKVPYLEIYDSQANYFLCRVKDRFTSHELALRLLKHNILIKDCGTKKAFNGGNYIRLSVRDRKDNHYLTETLKSL